MKKRLKMAFSSFIENFSHCHLQTIFLAAQYICYALFSSKDVPAEGNLNP